MEPQKKLKNIQYLICLHIQATCSEKQQLKPCQEAIQINAILLNVAGPQAKILGKFHQFVKPKCNPKLTQYCTGITGLTNQLIKSSPDLEGSIKQLEKWFKTFQFINQHNYTFVTWGNWTIKSCLLSQFKVKKLAFPQFINSFTDLKRVYNYQVQDDRKASIHDAAKKLQIQSIPKQNQTKGEQIVQKIAKVAILLYNNKKFKPDRKYVTIIRDVPNVNVTEDLEYLLVLDFEATCEDNVKLKPCSQIIQFPVMVVDLKQRKILSQFHEYVTPSYNPQLTKFCTQLTGITQEMVTNKLKLEQVLEKLDKWIYDQPYLHSKNFTLVTCGDWDLCSCLKTEAKVKNIQVQQYLKSYINIKKIYRQCVPQYDGSMGMMGMLKGINIPHEGRHHSGIDDVRNICNICIGLLNFNGFKYKKTHISYVK